VVTGPELPFTGSGATMPLVAVGVALLLVGLVLRRVPRR
jgi:LPXTG-motif cell wall-anchored protein